MDTSLAHENARLRALLQTQQDTIRQMAEYNRLLSQRVAAYASEINRLKALVTELQRMQFRKLSEKLHAHLVLLPPFRYLFVQLCVRRLFWYRRYTSFRSAMNAQWCFESTYFIELRILRYPCFRH